MNSPNITECDYPCQDTNHNFIFPKFNGNKEMISIIMISETPPIDHSHYFYESGAGSFFRTTQTAFNDAGYKVNSYDDLAKLGVYLTTAIKCSKTDYLVSSKTIKECAIKFLEPEILTLPNLQVVMCMGDFAIKAVNYLYKKNYKVSPISPGSTYKIRKEKHKFNDIRFIPSYTQTGDSFNLEQSKRKMIAEDIKLALSIIGK